MELSKYDVFEMTNFCRINRYGNLFDELIDPNVGETLISVTNVSNQILDPIRNESPPIKLDVTNDEDDEEFFVLNKERPFNHEQRNCLKVDAVKVLQPVIVEIPSTSERGTVYSNTFWRVTSRLGYCSKMVRMCENVVETMESNICLQ
jgi:hypothetical protein